MNFEEHITPTLMSGAGAQKTFAGIVTRDWYVFAGPNGGWIAATMLRALRLTVDDAARLPRTLTVDYISPPQEGAYEIKTWRMREGKSLSFVRAEMWQGDRLNVSAVATFSTDYKSPINIPHEAAPFATPFADCTDLEGKLPVHQQFILRPAFSAKPFERGTQTVGGGWTKLKQPPLEMNGEMLAAISDCWPPALFSVMSADQFNQSRGLPTIELSVYFIQPEIYSALDVSEPLLAHFHAPENIHGFFTEEGTIWSADGKLLARSRQFAISL